MPAITKDLKPNISDLATKSLALTNRYQELVKVLNEVDHHESRMEAVNGIRNWLLRDPQNGELLKAALQKQFSPEMAETMERLLWGFQNYHSIHHLFPRVPFYTYRAVFEKIEPVMLTKEGPIYHLGFSGLQQKEAAST